MGYEENSNEQVLDDYVCNRLVPFTEKGGLRTGATLRDHQDFGLMV